MSLLLCEGGPNSPDVRVLVKLLAGSCRVLPMGGKYGMGDRIKARREAIGQATVFGLLDSDFRERREPPADEPQEWNASDGTMLGWRWQRREIENYLIDPAVVSSALGAAAPDKGSYQLALEAARDAIAVYQAARAALSLCRPRFRPLPSAFGRRRGRDRHPFPDKLDEAACRAGIRETARAYREQQLVTDTDVEGRFATVLPDFQSGGPQYEHFLVAFAGKDLLWAMDGPLQDLGLCGAPVFRERLLLAIAGTIEDVGNWLPEWGSLRKLVIST